MRDLGPATGYEIRLTLDLAHRPTAWSVTALWEDGTYTVKPGSLGPFDSLEDALESITEALDKQGTLW